MSKQTSWIVTGVLVLAIVLGGINYRWTHPPHPPPPPEVWPYVLNQGDSAVLIDSAIFKDNVPVHHNGDTIYMERITFNEKYWDRYYQHCQSGLEPLKVRQIDLNHRVHLCQGRIDSLYTIAANVGDIHAYDRDVNHLSETITNLQKEQEVLGAIERQWLRYVGDYWDHFRADDTAAAPRMIFDDAHPVMINIRTHEGDIILDAPPAQHRDTLLHSHRGPVYP